jgi:GMP synthase (glutamine-hydrolysing)
MRVLILKNVSTEGPGTIENYLQEKGIEYFVVDLQKGSFPAGRDVDALILMGGPMSVNEANVYPYIAREIELARDFMNRGKKVLGICLGAQIMAKALGAQVYPGPEKEIGWYDIELQEEGVRDPLMKELAEEPDGGDFRRKFKVFHWHGETFDLPRGAAWLAKSALYPHQAFRYGSAAYALQFHIEVRREMVYEWLKNEPVDMARIAIETESFYNDYYGRALNFYKAFFCEPKS